MAAANRRVLTDDMMRLLHLDLPSLTNRSVERSCYSTHGCSRRLRVVSSCRWHNPHAGSDELARAERCRSPCVICLLRITRAALARRPLAKAKKCHVCRELHRGSGLANAALVGRLPRRGAAAVRDLARQALAACRPALAQQGAQAQAGSGAPAHGRTQLAAASRAA